MAFGSGCHRWWTCAALLLAAIAWALPARGATPLHLDAANQPVGLGDHGDAWIDSRGQVPVDTVASDPAIPWQPSREGAIYQLREGQALWLRFTLPPAPTVERWYLEIPYPAVDRVKLYGRRAGGQWAGQEAGDTIAVASWPVPHRHPLLPLQVSATEPRQYLLRVENAHSFSAPLNFVTESELSWREQRSSLVLGIYFGLAGLACALGVLSAITLRDKAYALYALSVALMTLAQGAMTGIAGLHLWPTLPWWNDLSPLVLPVLALGALLSFFAETVSIGERSPAMLGLVTGLSLLSVAVAVGIMSIERSYRYRLMVPYVIVASIGAILTLAWAARRGDRFAGWILLGSLPVLVGAAFPVARLAGWIPVSIWTMHGMQVALAIELPTLLLILMVRSQQRREHHRRMHGLDRIDPATGLLNAPVFQDRLMRMMARSQRLNHKGAVLLVDLVNLEQVRREFGARSAEELPLRIAGRLLATAREIDEVARLTPLRFGMLVEGPLTPEEAASIGPRVVARCLMPFKDKPAGWVPQVHVGQTTVPSDNNSAKDVLQALEALLASAGPENKRAVFTLK